MRLVCREEGVGGAGGKPFLCKFISGEWRRCILFKWESERRRVETAAVGCEGDKCKVDLISEPRQVMTGVESLPKLDGSRNGAWRVVLQLGEVVAWRVAGEL